MSAGPTHMVNRGELAAAYHDEGGPAFPFRLLPDDESTYFGMSLRDYFAAKALVGLYSMVATGAHGVSETDVEGGLAQQAYAMADAMLKARDAGSAA